MTRKKIERAADVYAAKTSPTYTNGDYDCIAIAEAFEHGAQWRINSVWHDVKEIPKENEYLLIDLGRKYLVMCFIIKRFYFSFCKREKSFVKWAYVKDLLPEMEIEDLEKMIPERKEEHKWAR